LGALSYKPKIGRTNYDRQKVSSKVGNFFEVGNPGVNLKPQRLGRGGRWTPFGTRQEKGCLVVLRGTPSKIVQLKTPLVGSESGGFQSVRVRLKRRRMDLI